MRISDWSSDVCSSDLQMPATARVHGGDELEARRVGHMGVGARHHHAPGLDRLAQRLQGGTLEFRQLVEEEHAEMGDRKSVVEGQSVSVRVDLGGRRVSKTKK